MTMLLRKDFSAVPSGSGRNCGTGLIGIGDNSSPPEGDNNSSPPVDILFRARFLKCEKKDFGELSSPGLPEGDDNLSGPVGTRDAAES